MMMNTWKCLLANNVFSFENSIQLHHYFLKVGLFDLFMFSFVFSYL